MGIAAAVVDVGWVNGLAAIRSLGRAGIRVLAIDHRPSALGFRSKYAERLLAPDPFEQEHRFVNVVRALGEVVVFPTHDNVLNAIARYADDLDVLTPFPSWALLERVQSKRVQLEQAQAAGVDVPAADPGTFPVIVKPDRSVEFKRRYKRQAFRCDTPAQLEEALAKAEEFGPIVQELVPGGDDALPRIAYADLTGETPPEARMNGSGKRWAITLLPGEPPAPQRPPYVDAVFAVDDPKPALVHLARVARSVVA